MSGGREPRASARPATTESLVRVVLAEEDFLAREGITRVLEGLGGIELVASCGNLEDLRDAVERLEPHVVVTDARLPPGHSDEGIRLAAELRATHPRVGVVVLGHQVELLHAAALFAEGSQRRAYLLRQRMRDAGELARAIEEVAGGGTAVDPAVIARLLSAHPRPGSALAALTPREVTVLGLLAEGLANSAIANRLGVTKRAVERQINSIFAKLDLGEEGEVSRRVKAALVFLAHEGRLDVSADVGGDAVG